MSSNIILPILLWLLILPAQGDVIVECPRFCKCDSYMQLNRAECSSKRLISAEVEVPQVVQILDLSYNDIDTIESSNFKSYRYLKYLDLSHNAITSLDLDSFVHLRRLMELDLSHNRLQYLDERVFERNYQLKKLNLEGNKFNSIALKPLLRSTSLLELNLRNCQINFVHSLLFTDLPNLASLDLSQNLLNTFQLEDFQGLQQLKVLQLSENVFKCDRTIKQKVKQLNDKDINVDLEECQFVDVESLPDEEKFQKMMVAAATNEQTEAESFIKKWRLKVAAEDETSYEEDEYQDISLENNNPLLSNNELLRFSPDEVLCEGHKHKLCQGYRNCLVALNTAWHEKRNSFTSSEAKFGFFLGVTCGVALVICMLTCAMCVKSCCASRRRDRLSVVDLQPCDMSAQPMTRPPQQLPPQVRRHPRRRAAAAPRTVVRYEGPVGENFLSRLFGRPARQQYYRTINHNTATMIRRLSRSNLFNNRLSQHILDRQFSAEQSGANESPAYNPTAPRPETPPPSYGDVIVNGCGDRK